MRDCESLRGTRVNGVAVNSEWTPLRVGDTVDIGGCLLTVGASLLLGWAQRDHACIRARAAESAQDEEPATPPDVAIVSWLRRGGDSRS